MRANISAGGGGAGRKGYKNDLSGRMARLDSLEEDKEREMCRTIQVYEQVEKAINGLEDAQERDVLFYRYIKDLGWQGIAKKMSYSERWVYMVHGKALAHLKIPKEISELQ